MHTGFFIIGAFLMGMAVGIFATVCVLTAKPINNKQENNQPTFDEADIYHAPKYYPRVTKEQRQ